MKMKIIIFLIANNAISALNAKNVPNALNVLAAVIALTVNVATTLMA